MNDAQDVVENLEVTTHSEEIKNVGEMDNQNLPTKFKAFCNVIEQLVSCLKDDAKLNRYIYEYPEILQSRINKDTEELQSLLNEVRETATSIKKLKSQQKCVKKEVSNIKKTIKRLKDDETRELESSLLRLDKDLYNRWTKSRWKSDELEELMFDVQEKLVALESLNNLIDRQLGKSKQNSTINEDPEENVSNSDQLVPLTSSAFSFESQIPLPPPCPMILPNRIVPLTVNSLNRNNSRLSWVHRRVRAERRGNVTAVTTNTDNFENEPFSFPVNVNNDTNEGILDNELPPLEFHLSRFSCDSTGTTSSTTSNGYSESTTSEMI
ncbi:uncharacterized protein LOC100680266 isoform X2 [Nasonia vitripennis]|nr:uncharacterized protein LOC100680266 isoform X2 [Nasonia vitripennis]